MSFLPPSKQMRALRVISSSLLSSHFTSSEIREIAEALMSDPGFRAELGMFLHDVASKVELTVRQRRDTLSRAKVTKKGDLVSVGLRLIKQKRLSKIEILDKLRRISPQAAEFFERRGDTVREILSTFSEHEPISKMQAFIDVLAGAAEGDEYLKGIVKDR